MTPTRSLDSAGTCPGCKAVRGRFHPILQLHDAQLTIARENGFASWPLFQAHLQAAIGIGPRRFRPHVRGFEWYEDRVSGVISMHKSGSAGAMETIRQNHPGFASMSDDDIRTADFNADDARVVLAREHGFDHWSDFKKHVEEIQSGKSYEPFTAAFDAIQTGEISAFSSILVHTRI